MNIRRVLLLGVSLLVAASAAEAQTRFSITGGALIPLGQFDDTTDASPRAGVRVEYQPVNALGKASRVSFFLSGYYTGLVLDPAHEEALKQAGQSTDAYMLEVGGGVRVYSRLSLFFISGGAGYVYAALEGDDAVEHGLDLNAGAGFAVPVYLFTAEAQALAHQVVVASDDFQYLEATVSLALPF
jgi:hypothetical protein